MAWTVDVRVMMVCAHEDGPVVRRHWTFAVGMRDYVDMGYCYYY